MEQSETQRLLLESGKRRFLDQGFKSAPLRAIAKDAGFTLGAFYGYYKTKEDLFYALTDETAAGFQAIIYSIAEEMDSLPPEERLFSMLDCYLARLPELAEYVCSHRDGMMLLLRCADGTKYAHFMDSFMLRSRERISEAADLAHQSGKQLSVPEPAGFRYLMQGYFDILSRIILEVNEPDEIVRLMRDVAMVYKNGMLSLMEEARQNA